MSASWSSRVEPLKIREKGRSEFHNMRRLYTKRSKDGHLLAPDSAALEGGASRKKRSNGGGGELYKINSHNWRHAKWNNKQCKH